MIGFLQFMRTCSRAGGSMALTLALSMACMPVQAHKGSDAYLDVQQLELGRVESSNAGASLAASFRLVLAVAVRDLDLLVPIDRNADAQVTWAEVKAATPQVLALLNKTVSLDVPAGGSGSSQANTPDPQGTCRLIWQADGLERRSDGVYFRAVSQARCPTESPLNFSYRLLKDEDSTHRLLVAGRVGGQDLLSTLSPQQGKLLAADDAPDHAATFHVGQYPTHRALAQRGLIGKGFLRRPTDAGLVCIVGQHEEQHLFGDAARGIIQRPGDGLNAHSAAVTVRRFTIAAIRAMRLSASYWRILPARTRDQ